MAAYRTVTAAAHGKLLLFGEHAAVYGRPAVGVTLPLTLTVYITRESDGSISAPGLPAEKLRRILDAIQRARALDNLKLPESFKLSVESSIPEGRGFGSSAALCAALAKGLVETASFSGHAEAQLIWKLAHAMEHTFHGSPSGIDTGLALYPGLSLFRSAPPGLPSRSALRGLPLHLLAIAVPRRGTTGELVADIKTRMNEGDVATQRAIRELGETAEEAARLLGDPSHADEERLPSAADRNERLMSLARLSSHAQEVLRSLGLSSPDVDRILEKGVEYGALGGKLSGAGGGGALFLLYRDRAAIKLGQSLLGDFLRTIEGLGRCPTYPFEWTGSRARLLDFQE